MTAAAEAAAEEGRAVEMAADVKLLVNRWLMQWFVEKNEFFTELAIIEGNTTSLNQSLNQRITNLNNSEIEDRNFEQTVCSFLGPTFAAPIFQQIETNGALDWEFFVINGTNFLAVANSNDVSAVNINSNIYRYDVNTNQFELFQQIETNDALDWEFFVINDVNYLAVANNYDGSTWNINSNIYRYDTMLAQFVLYQQIETSGAIDWEFFVINGTYWLAVANANNYDDSNYNINSNIYRYDTNTAQFVLFQQIETSLATAWSWGSECCRY